MRVTGDEKNYLLCSIITVQTQWAAFYKLPLSICTLALNANPKRVEFYSSDMLRKEGNFKVLGSNVRMNKKYDFKHIPWLINHRLQFPIPTGLQYMLNSIRWHMIITFIFHWISLSHRILGNNNNETLRGCWRDMLAYNEICVCLFISI